MSERKYAMSEFRRLELLISEGKISRRDFLRRVSALGLAAAVSPALLTGQSLAAAPKRGGRLRVGLAFGSTEDSLDPSLAIHSFSDIHVFTTTNHLVQFDAKGSLEPMLATSWEPSSDLKTWTWNIRKGVEFHNGKTLDANDVVVTINHHLAEGSKSGARPLLKSIKDIKAADKHVVIMSLHEPYLDFPAMMATPPLGIMPAKDGVADCLSGIGCGPFKLVSWRPGVRALYERFSNYWKPDMPYFDEVELLSMHDTTARTNALLTGKIDLMDQPDLKTVDMLGARPGIKVEETTGNGHYALCMRCDTAPFDNNEVRLALKHAVDRRAMLKTILGGHGGVGNDHPIGPANRFWAKELPQREYDPDKARYHLKKAGYGTLDVKLHTAEAAFRGAVDLAILYKEHAAKAGITIDVVREPNDGYWDSVWMKKPWTMDEWSGRMVEDLMFTVAYSAGAAWNETFWNNERFNKLLKEARTERDEGKRREMYVEMQLLVRDEGGAVVPLYTNWMWAMTDKLRHGPLHNYNRIDGYKFTERWWFA